MHYDLEDMSTVRIRKKNLILQFHNSTSLINNYCILMVLCFSAVLTHGRDPRL